MPTCEIDTILKTWPSVATSVRVPHAVEEYNALVVLLDHLIDEVGEDEAHPLASLCAQL